MGYADRNGNLVVAPKYDNADTFLSPDIPAVVKVGKKYGYINSAGTEVVSPSFDGAGKFSSATSLAPVKIDKKWGYIDAAGKMVIEPQFDSAGGFGSAIALAPVKIGNKWGYIDKSGSSIIAPQFDDARGFVDAFLAPIKIDKKWGYIDQTGSIVVAPKYGSASTFNKAGVSRVSIDGKVGLVDLSGKEIVAPQYEWIAYDYVVAGNTNLGVVKKDNKYGVIDAKGVLVYPLADEDVLIVGQDGKTLILEFTVERWCFAETVCLPVGRKSQPTRPQQDGRYLSETDIGNANVITVCSQSGTVLSALNGSASPAMSQTD